MYTTELYFESHVTVEPCFGQRLKLLKVFANQHNFRVADLIMKKCAGESETPNQKDSFCTCRSKSWDRIYEDTREFIECLTSVGFQVYRYKIENTLIDSRSEDTMELLVEMNHASEPPSFENTGTWKAGWSKVPPRDNGAYYLDIIDGNGLWELDVDIYDKDHRPEDRTMNGIRYKRIPPPDELEAMEECVRVLGNKVCNCLPQSWDDEKKNSRKRCERCDSLKKLDAIRKA